MIWKADVDWKWGMSIPSIVSFLSQIIFRESGQSIIPLTLTPPPPPPISCLPSFLTSFLPFPTYFLLIFILLNNYPLNILWIRFSNIFQIYIYSYWFLFISLNLSLVGISCKIHKANIHILEIDVPHLLLQALLSYKNFKGFLNVFVYFKYFDSN